MLRFYDSDQTYFERINKAVSEYSTSEEFKEFSESLSFTEETFVPIEEAKKSYLKAAIFSAAGTLLLFSAGLVTGVLSKGSK